MRDKQFTYKGHYCEIEADVEDDNIKLWHYVTKPDGTKLIAPLSPYVGEDALCAWIDAGCPAHPNNGNFGFDTRTRTLYP